MDATPDTAINPAPPSKGFRMPPLDLPVHQGSFFTGLRQLIASTPGHLHVEPSPIYFRVLRRAQAREQPSSVASEDVLMESKRAFLVWQHSSPSPQLAFLREDAAFTRPGNGDGLAATDDRPEASTNDVASQYYDLHIDSKPYSRFAAWMCKIDTPLTGWTSKDAPAPDQLVVLDLKRLPEVWEENVRLEWGAVRNPYHRVDTVSSSRRVQIFALAKDGITKHLIADTADLPPSQQVKALFETGYSVRWYLPSTAVEPGRLAGSHVDPPVDTSSFKFAADSKKTVCPYKGTAYYHSITLPDGELLPNVAWSYPDPIPALDLRGLIAFWCPGNDRLQLYIDGNLTQ